MVVTSGAQKGWRRVVIHGEVGTDVQGWRLSEAGDAKNGIAMQWMVGCVVAKQARRSNPLSGMVLRSKEKSRMARLASHGQGS